MLNSENGIAVPARSGKWTFPPPVAGRVCAVSAQTLRAKAGPSIGLVVIVQVRHLRRRGIPRGTSGRCRRSRRRPRNRASLAPRALCGRCRPARFLPASRGSSACATSAPPYASGSPPPAPPVLLQPPIDSPPAPQWLLRAQWLLRCASRLLRLRLPGSSACASVACPPPSGRSS